jgi:hypothetical protein
MQVYVQVELVLQDNGHSDTVDILFKNLNGLNEEDVKRAQYDVDYYMKEYNITKEVDVPDLIKFLRSTGGHDVMYKINGELQETNLQ